MKKIWMGAVLAGSLALAGCGGDKPAETAKTEATAPAAAGGALATPDEANGGTVTGKVAFAGEKPKMATLDMSANPVCERAHAGAPQKSEEVVVNDNGTLKYAFVWVKSGLPTDKQWAVPTTQVTPGSARLHVQAARDRLDDGPELRDQDQRPHQPQHPPHADGESPIGTNRSRRGRRR